MALSRLDITAVRNLRAASLRELAATNIFFGDNGSGKTSVLESLYLLGMARSFRSGHIAIFGCHYYFSPLSFVLLFVRILDIPYLILSPPLVSPQGYMGGVQFFTI